MVKLNFAADYESSIRIFFNLDTSIFVVSRGESWRVVESRGESWRAVVNRGERRVYMITSPTLDGTTRTTYLSRSTEDMCIVTASFASIIINLFICQVHTACSLSPRLKHCYHCTG